MASLILLTYILNLLTIIYNVQASLIIFETNSKIYFNENEKNIYLNNQYQYYAITNVDMPGKWYSYKNIINSFYMHGYLNKTSSTSATTNSSTNNSNRCKLIYNFNLNNNSFNETNPDNSQSSNKFNDSNITFNDDINRKNIFNNKRGNIMSITYDYAKNQLHIKNETSVDSYTSSFNNNTNTSDDTLLDDNINNEHEQTHYQKENNLKSLTISISHDMMTSEENKNSSNTTTIENLINSNQPLLFINYDDLIEQGCSFQDVIIANHWIIEKEIESKKNSTEIKTITRKVCNETDNSEAFKNKGINKDSQEIDDDNNNKNEIENEFSDEEMNEYMYNNSFIPSLIAVIVKEKELEIIKKENNINTIGKKYLHQTSNLEIPITFLSKSEYEKLMNNSKLNELWIQVTPGK